MSRGVGSNEWLSVPGLRSIEISASVPATARTASYCANIVVTTEIFPGFAKDERDSAARITAAIFVLEFIVFS